MTRTQVQIPDVLFGRIRRYAEIRETSPTFHVRARFELFSGGAVVNFLGNSGVGGPEMAEMACSVDLPY